jgi:hydrogenase nickel incorporation protein HypA/HybF
LHELSIAQSIVEFALYEADRNRADRVVELDVEVGELMQIDTEVLRNALGALMAGPRLAGAMARISLESAHFSCHRCGTEWDMLEAKRQLSAVPESLLIREPDSNEVPLHFLPDLYAAYIRCPACGSSDFNALRGDDIRVMRVVLE